VSARTWSDQQLAIFRFFVEAEGHLVVIARAGCGKTTTIVEAVTRWLAVNPGKRVTVCAFNKRIEQELVTRFVGLPVTVKTLHAIGFACVRRFWPTIRINDAKKDPVSRKDALTQRACGNRAPDTILKLVSKLHTLAREIHPMATEAAELYTLAQEKSCEPDEEWTDQGFDLHYVCDRAVAAMKLAEEKPVGTGIDFADMIFLPVRLGWLHATEDLVVVDEAQDMTNAKLKIARGICKGRMVLVGDDRQALYGFIGATADGLFTMAAELAATQLSLKTTYRCGRAIVALAAELVTDFEAGPTNPEGTLLNLAEEKLADTAELGDFILSRVNAPLVATAMTLLRSGKRARVAGKDIGEDLIRLVKRVGKSARSVPEFLVRLAGWSEMQCTRARKAGRSEDATEHMIEGILDQAEMLRNLADNARNVAEISERVEALFTDKGLGAADVITLSSVHKAKGLEADRVFILADTLKNTTEEELNIQYVAITRAKQTLVWVGGTPLAEEKVA
jgi:DNA helicase-2/ATP-dependent DNA helicase PcrA